MKTILICLATLMGTTALARDLTKADARPQAPTFKARSLDNKRVDLTEHRGEVVILAFWATWCAPCKKSMAELDELRKAHAGKVTLLAISIDDAQSLSRVRSTRRGRRWDFPVLHDTDGKLAQDYNPRGIAPLTVMLDGQGRVAATWEGYNPSDADDYVKIVDALVAELPQPPPTSQPTK